MKRKILFLLFSGDTCRQNHALRYAIDLARAGHGIQVIFEGDATQALGQKNAGFLKLLESAMALGLVVGACQAASSGCGKPERDVLSHAETLGIPLLDGLDGHAPIREFVEQGFELVTF